MSALTAGWTTDAFPQDTRRPTRRHSAALLIVRTAHSIKTHFVAQMCRDSTRMCAEPAVADEQAYPSTRTGVPTLTQVMSQYAAGLGICTQPWLPVSYAPVGPMCGTLLPGPKSERHQASCRK